MDRDRAGRTGAGDFGGRHDVIALPARLRAGARLHPAPASRAALQAAADQRRAPGAGVRSPGAAAGWPAGAALRPRVPWGRAMGRWTGPRAGRVLLLAVGAHRYAGEARRRDPADLAGPAAAERSRLRRALGSR